MILQMELLAGILPWLQIILSVILVAGVLLQQTGAGVGGAFGGGDTGSINHTRRGAEKMLFRLTIVVGILFVLSVFLSLYI